MVYYPYFLAYCLFSHDQSLLQNPELYTIWKYFLKVLFTKYLLYVLKMIQNRFLAKRNLWIVQLWFYYLEFIFTWLIIAPNARAVHDLEVFYEISIFHNTYLCTQNVVKQIYKFVNGVKAWFSCLKFIFTWPNIVSKITVVHHLQVFYPHFPQCFCIYRQNDLK